MNVLSPTTQAFVEDSLVKAGQVSQPQLAELKQRAATAGQPLLSLLIEEGKITDEELTKTLARANSIPYVNLSSATIEPKLLALLPQDIAEHYMAVPLGEMQRSLVVAMVDADNLQAVDFLSKKVNRPLKVYAASESGIRHILGQYPKSALPAAGALLAPAAATPAAPAGGAAPPASPATPAAGLGLPPIAGLADSSPVSKILTSIMEYAVTHMASDIHIEPLEAELKVRCRIDGVLMEIMRLPKSTEAPLVSRVKILSNLKIDEHRVPQDGQFTVSVGNKSVDLRIAISPVVWGEQVVIRLLDKSDTSFKFEDLGYIGRSLRRLQLGLRQPHGMVLTSGPTGSGKSTSMYAMIQAIKNDTINIVTLEDPVEYKIDGVNQIQINPGVGLTFATGLRSVLRQDPDVVMVGEIRDKETATLAVQAALTGHLVFSTLHTNNAAGILPRLLDMAIEPFLIASTVHTVIGQRLVRKNISGGLTAASSKAETLAIQQTLGSLLPKTPAEAAKLELDLGYHNLPLATQNAYTLFKGKPTVDSPTGYKGRMGLYEVFQVSEVIQDLILKRATSAMIQRAAVGEGMITMRQDGYLKALAGLTSLDEVNRVATLGGN